MKSLGDKIRYFRNQKGWTQEEMAHRLEINLPSYSKIERNITDVNYSRLEQIAKVFGITPAELLATSTEQFNYHRTIQEQQKEIIILQKEVNSLQKQLLNFHQQKSLSSPKKKKRKGK